MAGEAQSGSLSLQQLDPAAMATANAAPESQDSSAAASALPSLNPAPILLRPAI